jgi:hypothetical protein
VRRIVAVEPIVDVAMGDDALRAVVILAGRLPGWSTGYAIASITVRARLFAGASRIRTLRPAVVEDHLPCGQFMRMGSRPSQFSAASRT